MKRLILPIASSPAEGAHQAAPVLSLAELGPETINVEGLDLLVRGVVWFDVGDGPPVPVDTTGFWKRPCTALG